MNTTLPVFQPTNLKTLSADSFLRRLVMGATDLIMAEALRQLAAQFGTDEGDLPEDMQEPLDTAVYFAIDCEGGNYMRFKVSIDALRPEDIEEQAIKTEAITIPSDAEVEAYERAEAEAEEHGTLVLGDSGIQ